MPRHFNFRGLQAKTAGALSLLLVLIIAGLIAMNLMDLHSTSQKEVKDSCQMLINSAYNAVLHPMAINDTETIRQQMQAYGRSMEDIEVMVFGFNHGVTYSSRKEQMGGDLRKIISSAKLHSALAGLFSTGVLSKSCFMELSGGKTFFITVIPMKNEKRCHHCHGTSRPVLGGVLVRRDVSVLTAHQAGLRLRNILVGCAGILISMALIWFLLRVLVINPVDRLVEASGHMAHGDMTCRVDSGRKDELGALAESINKTTDSLGSVIREVEGQAGHLAEGVSQQAAAIEETAAGTEEISIMLRKNAENSQEVQSLLGQTISDMQQARESMRSLSENMAQTSAASDEVAKIIKSIDEIAFQTNLLALNAAVEAARAGESGAGFAVVADEVRNLALRAAEAADQTNEMISSIVDKIKESHQLVDESDGNYRNVAVKIRKVAELSDEIADNASEQTEGINQLNNAMNTIDGVTQQQAAMAQSLAEMMGRFTVRAQDGENRRLPTKEHDPLLLTEGPRT